jgi:hypothetical protein
VRLSRGQFQKFRDDQEGQRYKRYYSDKENAHRPEKRSVGWSRVFVRHSTASFFGGIILPVGEFQPPRLHFITEGIYDPMNPPISQVFPD